MVGREGERARWGLGLGGRWGEEGAQGTPTGRKPTLWAGRASSQPVGGFAGLCGPPGEGGEHPAGCRPGWGQERGREYRPSRGV